MLRNGEFPRHHGRRAEDDKAESLLDSMLMTFGKWKQLLAMFVAVIAAASATSAFVGTYASTPQRVARLEVRVDSGLKEIRDSLSVIRNERDMISERIELLLRLNCPRVMQPDLVRSCQPYISPGGN